MPFITMPPYRPSENETTRAPDSHGIAPLSADASVEVEARVAPTDSTTPVAQDDAVTVLDVEPMEHDTHTSETDAISAQDITDKVFTSPREQHGQHPDHDEMVALTSRVQDGHKVLSGPDGVFAIHVPSAWDSRAIQTRQEGTDGSTYTMITAPDIEAFVRADDQPGASLFAIPLDFVIIQPTLDHLLDQITPQRGADRTFYRTGLIRKKMRFGLEQWDSETENANLQVMAGESADTRWLYLLAIHAIDLGKATTDDAVIDAETYDEMVTSIYGPDVLRFCRQAVSR